MNKQLEAAAEARGKVVKRIVRTGFESISIQFEDNTEINIGAECDGHMFLWNSFNYRSVLPSEYEEIE